MVVSVVLALWWQHYDGNGGGLKATKAVVMT